jgi:hypothetical protein
MRKCDKKKGEEKESENERRRSRERGDIELR